MRKSRFTDEQMGAYVKQGAFGDSMRSMYSPNEPTPVAGGYVNGW
jgi:hypothetical protein